VARGLQQATIVLLVVPWAMIASASYWYWSRYGRYDELEAGDGDE
jgi:DNA-binding transcriptional regulator of glucitol operon